MPYIPRTTTITRGTIKRVETRLQGLQGVGRVGRVGNLGQFDILSSTAIGPLKDLLDWITGRSGELKITATQFVEGMVKTMYGLDPDCRMPTPGIQIIAGAQPKKFCSGSIAGMIERCLLSNAESSLNQIQSQFTERTQRNSSGGWIYPEGQFVKQWMDQYWANDKSNLTNAITTARAICGVGGGGPVVVPLPVPGPDGTPTCSSPSYKYNPYTERCEYIVPGVTGISNTTILMVGAFALAAMFLLKR